MPADSPQVRAAQTSRPSQASRPSTATLLESLRRDWQAARPDLNAQPMLSVLRLTRLGAALQAEVDAPLHAEGLNAAGWDLLLTLYRSAPPGGLSPGQLSELSAVSGPTTTNRVARLLARGLITRRADDRDRRSARVSLTPAGRAAVERLLPGHLHRETRALAALTTTELETLDRLAARLLGALEGDSGG
ncbi:MarR family transcriptional regulator [Deinococcus sp.]|uniref:MarR family winged helix-turn-helix transcriptional regulator n=1 Tax=Deinococcus sp. TaxID=47478 RepID=UPI0025BFF7B8|nr:MarR family transcriptional regulator [Deinococcus sp.]